MSKTKTLIKNTFDAYFDRLREMAVTVQQLHRISRDVQDDRVKAEIEEVIRSLECEMKGYAEKLKSGGTEILERVA